MAPFVPRARQRWRMVVVSLFPSAAADEDECVCALFALFPFDFLQLIEKSINALIGFSFRVLLKIAHRSADMQIMLAQIRPVPGDLGDRFPDMARWSRHFIPESLLPHNAKRCGRFLPLDASFEREALYTNRAAAHAVCVFDSPMNGYLRLMQQLQCGPGKGCSWNKNEAPRDCVSVMQARRSRMLYYALIFLIVAIIAGILGFGGIAGASAGIAQILFFLFLVFLVISLIAGFIRRT
jgi:uncharacterized membrane protein YtjA (UPF0391 family)